MTTLAELRAEHAHLVKMLDHWESEQATLSDEGDRAFATRQHALTLARMRAIAKEMAAWQAAGDAP